MFLNTFFLFFLLCRVLLRGAQTNCSASSYLHNSPAKSSSGNLWSPTKTFLEDEDGERGEERQKGGASPPTCFPALVVAESELVLSAVAPLGVTYNQNYSPADMRERYN